MNDLIKNKKNLSEYCEYSHVMANFSHKVLYKATVSLQKTWKNYQLDSYGIHMSIK